MKTYEVYHVPSHLTREAWCLNDSEINAFIIAHRKEYIHVATVHEVESLDKVYELTNSIEQYWGCNKKVAVHNEEATEAPRATIATRRGATRGHRSTSVMDIITTKTEFGVTLTWYVARSGFEQYLDPI